jgi:hypothetical protein
LWHDGGSSSVRIESRHFDIFMLTMKKDTLVIHV